MKEMCDPNIVDKLHRELKIFTNACFILDKINCEGLLFNLQTSISELIDNELRFALRELVKLDQKIKNYEIKNQLINNTYIFKENLKHISNCLSFFKSRFGLEGKN